jgi:hypothetical protein
MGLRERLNRLKRQTEGPLVAVPQASGRSRLFTQRDLAQGYLVALRRAQGEDIDHELCKAARESSAPHWAEGIYAEPVAEDVPEDLSEP